MQKKRHYGAFFLYLEEKFINKALKDVPKVKKSQEHSNCANTANKARNRRSKIAYPLEKLISLK
ncbi:MAG: hypothetical protein VX737_04395 [Pseudomonadota bacterium]|nr:hypothetical protein [Pseudomonadota bacterium]